MNNIIGLLAEILVRILISPIYHFPDSYCIILQYPAPQIIYTNLLGLGLELHSRACRRDVWRRDRTVAIKRYGGRCCVATIMSGHCIFTLLRKTRPRC